jgi:predicted transglutaminase-like cysteine proteinase
MISSKARGAVLRGFTFSGAVLATLALAGAAHGGSPMITGGLTSQPIGHYEFCKANPGECSVRPRDAGPERFTESLWGEIGVINAEVNHSIRPMNDFDIYGKDEVWAFPDGVGDCEDYVLVKRRMLNERGIALSNLLITVVRKPDGEGHAVLTVRTDTGDFILDNLTDTVRPWTETGYRFLKRQAADHTGRWVTIREGQSTLVGSVE